VGEFEAIGDYPTRAANVVAVGDVTSRVISRDLYLDYLLGHPAASLALLRILIQRLGAADRRRIAATAAAATDALAHYLVELADSTRQNGVDHAEITVPLAQHDLASLIGVSRNSLVRALALLRSRALIATEGRTITIVDEAGLRGYAEEHHAGQAED
jgi:CRP-like cAMP-binding protein